MVLFEDNVIGDANCHYPDGGEKGVTIWGPRGPRDDVILSRSGDPGDSWTGYFTFTQPRCYHEYPDPGGTSVCNLTYTISIDQSTTADEVGPIDLYLNGIYQGPRYHSKIEDHDLTETIDIAQARHDGELIFRDTGEDWQNYSITFTNRDPNGVSVFIKNLKLVRIYQMAGIPIVINPNEQCDCTPEKQPCSYRPLETFEQQSDFAVRVDGPCNYTDCTNFSTTYWGYDDHVTHIDAGQTVSWTWTNPPNSSNNYSAPQSCLFNFNNVITNSSIIPLNINDVKFSIKVNDSDWADFYHTKVPYHSLFHSVDLATHPVLSATGGYDDQPNAENTLQLKVQPNAENIGLALCDGINCSGSGSVCCSGTSSNNAGGRVNIYRVYQTVKLWAQKTITVTQTSGGTISPGTTNAWTYHSQNFTITPNEGYEIADVITTGNVHRGAISSYTFNNVTEDQTITATFVQQTRVELHSIDQDILWEIYDAEWYLNNNPMGTQPDTYALQPGTYSFQTQQPYGPWNATYIKKNGTYLTDGNDTGQINIPTGTTVLDFYYDYQNPPSFNVQVRCWETVTYTQGYGIQIYVDQLPWALSPASGSLQMDTYNIGVASPIQGYYCYGATVTYNQGQYWVDNFSDIAIVSDTTIDFWYGY